MQYWLVKSEPHTFSFADLRRLGEDHWDGVRNYQARNNLKAMKKGDQLLFYHSNTDKAVVGLAEVAQEHYPDPTDQSGQWVAVRVKPLRALKKPVTLAQMKADPRLAEMALIRQGRLSVMPVTKAEFDRVVKLGGS